MQSLLFYHLQLAAWNNVHVNIYNTVHNEKTFTLSRAIQNRQNLTGLICILRATLIIYVLYMCAMLMCLLNDSTLK